MYEKNTWKTGDIVTSQKLNHIEQGIEAGGSGGGDYFVKITIDTSASTFATDKTFDEAMDAYKSGKNVMLIWPFDGGPGGEAYHVSNLSDITLSTSDDSPISFAFSTIAYNDGGYKYYRFNWWSGTSGPAQIVKLSTISS